MTTAFLAFALWFNLVCCKDKQNQTNTQTPVSASFELTVSVNPNDLTEADLGRLRQALRDGNLYVDDLHAKWVKLRDLELWFDLSTRLDGIEDDPLAWCKLHERVFDRWQKSAYLLIRTEPNSSLTGLTIRTVRQSENRFGFPALDLEFSEESQKRIDELIAANSGARFAAIVQGEVISTTREPPWIEIQDFKKGEAERERLMKLLRSAE